MFSPKWKKEALHLAKGAKKFIDYKRDLLTPDRVAEIQSRHDDLLSAIRGRDLAKVTEASKQVRVVCEKSLPAEKPLGWLEENVEVMFVAIVIALGLRAYYLQPFRIPTGSMQPTLNGIIGKPVATKDWPAFPKRMWEKAVRGRSYVKVIADRDLQVPVGVTQDGKYVSDLRDMQFMHFFSRSELHCKDGSTVQMPAPGSQIYEAGFSEALRKASANNGLIPSGTVLCEGTIDSGDLVLVDKFSYHFRKPRRGEVFVFDTIDIKGIQLRSGPQGAGSNYIKRLVGVPGDTLEVRSPNLIVNGKVAREPGIQRVMQGKGPYHINPDGYGYAKPEGQHHGLTLEQYITKPGDKLELAAKARPGMREYAAMGDNTGNSLDSRYWGKVKEFNVVGPALFTLWPITTGHWGIIR